MEYARKKKYARKNVKEGDKIAYGNFLEVWLKTSLKVQVQKLKRV